MQEVKDMKNLPFSIVKRANSRYYYVKFKNDETGMYMPAISTKQDSKAKAIEKAFEWYRNGIPKKGETVSLQQLSLRDLTKTIDISKSDALFLCNELQCRGLLKNFIPAESKKAIDLSEYLLNFWNWNTSPYIKEKLRKKHSIHRSHAIEMTGVINKYWIPFFKGKMLGELTRQDIDDFIIHLETLEDRAMEEQARIDKELEEKAVREKAAIAAGLQKPKRKNAVSPKRKIIRFPKSAKRKNSIIQAGTIALTYAYNKEIIDRDITKGITWFSSTSQERLILTPEIAEAIFRVQWSDDRSRLANILAMVTGMRAGEIQGLRVQDLGKDCLYVRHSWNFEDGLKLTKTNESRTVEVPFPGLIQELIELAKRNPHIQSMDSYIFWAELSANKPMEQDIFLRDLRAALIKTGMSNNESAKLYTFHGWRHFFTSYMQEKINEKLLQKETGHKTKSMVRHYANHQIAGDRERIQQAKIDTFGRLLPDYTDNSKVVGE